MLHVIFLYVAEADVCGVWMESRTIQYPRN